MTDDKPKLGRPAPLGRKLVCSVRLTPDVDAYCRQHALRFAVLEDNTRASKDFKEWMKNRKQATE